MKAIILVYSFWLITIDWEVIKKTGLLFLAAVGYILGVTLMAILLAVQSWSEALYGKRQGECVSSDLP
jgi:hypothetical protein